MPRPRPATSASEKPVMMPEPMRHLPPLRQIGEGLKRPECVLAHESGLLFVPDWTDQGGISVINTRGEVLRVQAKNCDFPLRPNGIALEKNGSFLLAHMGDETGGVYRLQADGQVELVVATANHRKLPPTNYIVHDSTGRLWITVSTEIIPRADDYRFTASTGFIAVAEPGNTNARIVADGLGYTNECVVDEKRGFVYVNETFARRLRKFSLGADGTLSTPVVLAEFGAATYPDGLALDESGTLWVTSIVSNRVLCVNPAGKITVIIEDSDAAHLAWTEAAFQSQTMGRPHLDQAKSQVLKNISNLAFGGPQKRTAYLGNLLGESIPYFETDVPGVALPHWNVPLGPLSEFL